MKILIIDIETGPNLVHAWGLWNQNIGLSQFLEAGEVICFAAKWLDGKKVHFYSTHHDGKQAMLDAAHRMLSESDAVVHFNGKRFDIPHLNREFIEAGMPPPAPYAQIDLLPVARKQFKFASNKLDFLAGALNLGAKKQHTGHRLWVDCLAGDGPAWKLMRQYNKHDVLLTERLYLKLLPWITSHPHHGLYSGTDFCCPTCGSEDLERRGFALTGVGRFQQYRCKSCGGWSRDTRRNLGMTNTQVK
jgi:hypothetical protein